MIMIAESGATKTDWRLVKEDGSVVSASSPGLNPSALNSDGINDVIGSVIPGLNPEGRMIREIHFYGAGLVNEAAAAPLSDALELWCPFSLKRFHSDMLAAARALFGNGSGIVAIMGTGSNSCLYRDGEIVKNIRPGGYVLGDEGSGMALGKALLADFVKGLLPKDVEADFVAESGLDYAGIVRRVYREPAPSAFMASFAPFVMSRLDEPYMRKLAEDCVESFVKRSLSRYESASGLPVGVVGSFGCACEDMLHEIGGSYGLTFVRFLKSPIDELVKYHGI
ncbi:MAG: hypothetical protein IJ971_10420 [Bacteroidales bacterium]|nr:hypothetical protein [Bacteroidales bacterium]